MGSTLKKKAFREALYLPNGIPLPRFPQKYVWSPVQRSSHNELPTRRICHNKAQWSVISDRGITGRSVQWCINRARFDTIVQWRAYNDDHWKGKWGKMWYTLKALIFAGTNFCGNLFSREFIFAIHNFNYFVRTYFHEFRKFFKFEILLSTLK